MTTHSPSRTLTVAVVTPIDAELVEPIRAVADGVEVLYEPDLLPPIRYPGDHQGVEGFSRDPDSERRWQELLASAEVLFGIPGDSPSGLAAAVRSNPRLRWVQGTAAGTGEQVKAAALSEEELERVVITSASGVHVGPLAEFCLLGLLHFTKDVPRLRADQHARHWDHYPVAELRGSTLLVLGLGAIGTEVARLAKAFGMHTIGVNRRGVSDSPYVDEVYSPERLHDVLARAQAVVVTLPMTEETEGMLDADAFAAVRPGAILVDAGRGGVIDESALAQALREQRLKGAALEVFATEPLPTDSPLWDLPNVLISPHTAALSTHENERIDELFTENLRRYLRGEELLSRVDTKLFY
ncbi:MAG: hydroxyacid dehydrogenase [Solirubrobacterales bacterium]|nr:MAG: hydroxyacid dehydrogenase [Solirubrobacterales bacterium]PZS08024.1 MAG: hydroxyacid dehydrogenase [Solirubrobacterales bacterium]